MKIENFEMERYQSIWENRVKYNLTESGVHPYSLDEFLSEKEKKELLELRLGYGHTNGSEELRKTISRLYQGADKGNVLVTTGSAEANFLTVWSQLEPEDELILMLPNYMQIWGLARSFGVHIKPLYLKEDLDWAPDLNDLEALISEKTRMIAVCNPNNPTGAVLSEKAMEEIAFLAKKHDLWIFADEVYRGSELSGRETPSFWGMTDKVIVSCGLSKSYAFPGLRLGWILSPEAVTEQIWAYHDYTTISSSIFSNYIADLILQPVRRKSVLDRTRALLNMNLKSLDKWIAAHKDFFQFVPPKAGAITFIRYSMDINSTDWMMKLIEDKSVFVVAGDCFGMDCFIRIGIGTEPSHFSTALGCIAQTMDVFRT